MGVLAQQIGGNSTECSTVVEAYTKENINITGPLGGESTGYWWIPLTKGQYHEKRFQVMPSSWYILGHYMGSLSGGFCGDLPGQFCQNLDHTQSQF